MENLGALWIDKNLSTLIQDISERASILGVPIKALGDDRIRINNNYYYLTSERYKALSSTSYTRKTMKKQNDIVMMNNIIRDLGHPGIGDRPSN